MSSSQSRVDCQGRARQGHEIPPFRLHANCWINLLTFAVSSNRVAPLSNVPSWKLITTKDASRGCENRCAIQASFLSQPRPVPKQPRAVGSSARIRPHQATDLSLSAPRGRLRSASRPAPSPRPPAPARDRMIVFLQWGSVLSGWAGPLTVMVLGSLQPPAGRRQGPGCAGRAGRPARRPANLTYGCRGGGRRLLRSMHGDGEALVRRSNRRAAPWAPWPRHGAAMSCPSH